MIRHHLEISTAHMPSSTPDFGDGSALEAVEHEHGFIVKFDRDAGAVGGLPVFDW